ncbi:uncharacterized protein ACH125_005758 [Urocitellus parryii]
MRHQDFALGWEWTAVTAVGGAAPVAEEVSAPAARSLSCSRCGAGSRWRRGAEVAPRGRSSEAVRSGDARTARCSRRRSSFRSLLCGLASQGSPSSQAAPLTAASCAGARVACSPLPAGGAGAGLVHRVSEGRVPRDRPLVGVAAGTGPAHSRRPSPEFDLGHHQHRTMQAHELFWYFRMPELVDIRQYVRTLPTNTLMGFGAFAAITTFWYATRPKALKPPCDLSMQSVEVPGSDGTRRSALLDSDEPLVYFHDDVRTLYEGFQRGIQVSNDGPCLGSQKPDQPYEWLSYKQVAEMSECIGSALLHKGFKPSPDQFIGIFAQNRPEVLTVSHLLDRGLRVLNQG